MGIIAGLVAFFLTRYLWPEWPDYVPAIIAFQCMILGEVGYIQHYVKEIKEKMGIK